MKLVHFAGAILFVASAVYLFVYTLLQAGKNWWLILSLSGYSGLIGFLIISLYLFAIYRSVGRNQKIEIEHPLTTSIYYVAFYDSSPFLGGLAGGIGAIGANNFMQYSLVIATGSLWTTFIVWIIVDPMIALIEMLLPVSRQHRRKRLVLARARREKEQMKKKQLLNEIEAREKQEQLRWNKILQPYAEKLAELVIEKKIPLENREAEAVDIGLTTWRMGGLSCMQRLHSMSMEICLQRESDAMLIDYISLWWDGIGNWRVRYPEEMIKTI